ncbi:nucleoside triphosphate pyrophosphatase [Pseudoroseicyclus aestuarii]|uniref:Maf family protein n=1 Tax=Pseudoroseicyclus aestuarii TaxID=1795041 RepID=UPI00319E1745
MLASGSQTRAALLRAARVPFEVAPVRVDEAALREALVAEGAPAPDIAGALAELKAMRGGARRPEALVLGCDQILDCEGQLYGKPETPQAALDQLRALRGRTHRLLSAAVLVEEGRPVWRHVGTVRMIMRDASDHWLKGYVDRNWPSIKGSAGAYKLEEEGVRLFTMVQGDYFTVMGMPLTELLNHLILRGQIDA